MVNKGYIVNHASRTVIVSLIDLYTNEEITNELDYFEDVQSMCRILLALVEAKKLGYAVAYYDPVYGYGYPSKTIRSGPISIGKTYYLSMNIRQRGEVGFPGTYTIKCNGVNTGVKTVIHLLEDVTEIIDIITTDNE